MKNVAIAEEKNENRKNGKAVNSTSQKSKKENNFGGLTPVPGRILKFR